MDGVTDLLLDSAEDTDVDVGETVHVLYSSLSCLLTSRFLPSWLEAIHACINW